MLSQNLTLPVIKILAAQLICYPNAHLLDQTCARFQTSNLPFNTESSGAIFALLCAAGVNRDWTRFHELSQLILEHAGANQAFLTGIEAFFRGTSTATRVTSFLPVLPLPLEVNYALITHYSGAGASAVSASKPRAGSGPAPGKPSASNGPSSNAP